MNLAEWIRTGHDVTYFACNPMNAAALRRAELLEELAVLAGRGCVGDVGGWHIWHNALRVLEILVALAEGDA